MAQHGTRRVPRIVWFVVPVLLGVGALSGVLALRSHQQQPAARTGAKQAPASELSGARVPEAIELARGKNPTKVVDAYAAWASDAEAVQARKYLLGSLFQEENLPKKLTWVLAAIEADSTPPEQDALWSYLTESLAELWQGETATSAMDLVIAEERPRARRALISSFAQLVQSERLNELSAEQRQVLTETLIDIAPQVPPGQKSEVEASLRKLGGNDLADIVAGKGLTGQDGHVLESERAYQKSLEETSAAVAQKEAAGPK
jgi:hypothetical protein